MGFLIYSLREAISNFYLNVGALVLNKVLFDGLSVDWDILKLMKFHWWVALSNEARLFCYRSSLILWKHCFYWTSIACYLLLFTMRSSHFYISQSYISFVIFNMLLGMLLKCYVFLFFLSDRVKLIVDELFNRKLDYLL